MDSSYQDLARAGKRFDGSQATGKIRIAMLSDASTQHLVPLLRLFFGRRGLDAAIYEGGFDSVELEAFNSQSRLYDFQPDVVVILNATQALRASFANRKGDAGAFLGEMCGRITAVWDAIRANSRAVVLQSTFVTPYERCFGNFDRQVPSSLTSVVSSLNRHIDEEARSRAGILVNDVAFTASCLGLQQWFDDRFWDLAKSFCALECMGPLVRNIVDIAMTTRGWAVKCVILDLDNTLWGGVIGDDGLDGILLAAHGNGEAFYRFQGFLKELHRRGILLAVCSKNEMAAALLPFERHPEMLLKRQDIAVFVANWKDKAENIRYIREILNIGFDSMVFLDDNPFERGLVKGVLPEVIVPELPDDPADYVRAIAELNLFETASFSAEDTQRADFYRVEAERREAQGAFSSAAAFLESLDMRIAVSRFDPFHLPRIAQLIQRSNQFNLTTHRYTAAECEAMMNDPACLPLYAKLSDRMGDHGLIGVIVLDPGPEELVIRDWLMSCRVLARGVEQYLMNLVVAEARARGLAKIRGQYIPTAKNQMVREFFAPFGFVVATNSRDGRTDWVLDVALYQPARTWLSPLESNPFEVNELCQKP